MPTVTMKAPSTSSDAEDGDDEVLNPEYQALLKTITREQVDEDITRCPHVETRERMKQVSHFTFSHR